MEVVETCGKGTLSSGEPSNKRSIPSIYDDDEVVGFEKDAEIIMKTLIRGTKERDVISIYGMPGLGKTTLARKMYNDPATVHHFDVTVWCAVSQAYNRRTLLVEIFKQATNDKSEITEDVDIADKLQKALKGRRYLIVLDDIWDVEAWEDLGICFPHGERGSRVMVTTRIEEVAKHLQHHSDPYSLSFLTSKQSWKLLEKKVFRGESCPPDLLKAGLQVAQHCKGLPLVVVLVAGIISKMGREASLWLEVANDLSSLALGEQSMKVIQSSYDHLEDHLKHCLLYMALFPEDHKIPVDNLLKLWMAEEFVLNAETENMEEACRVCLSDLHNRSLVMVSGMSITRDKEYCSLHDVVREFCLRKLTEDKYMQLSVPYNPYQHLHSTESRLCIYIHDDLVKQLHHSEYQLDKIPMLHFKETNSLGFIAHPEFNTWKNRYSNPLHFKETNSLGFIARTKLNIWKNRYSNPLHFKEKNSLGFIARTKLNIWKNRYSNPLHFKETNSLDFIAHPKLNTWNPLDLVVKLRFVRALHLMDVELPNSWATAMQSLTQLRYLALYVQQFELNWISHLHNLQTLQLKSGTWIRLRAATLLKMTNLRHVNIDRFYVVREENDEGSFEECSTTMNMKTFRTCDIPLDNMKARFWWRFPNLEEFDLQVKDEPKFPLFPIAEVHTRLHSLSLKLSLLNFYSSVGWERYFVFPSNLRRLYLFGSFLTEGMILNIARLKKLESLELFVGFPWRTSQSYCWDVTNVEFPALKYLTLISVHMNEWKASEESFPVLEMLVIRGCNDFKEIPPSFADIPTLRLIELSDCIDSLGVSAMNIKREIEENTGCDTLQVLGVKTE